ncbi:MAG: monofunctional biosynthetic peptidoglycan transglycosylase [Rhizobiales bacterium]|nr:monofunctional biosynthetic peptidoglycan transglycosylase [Hyphomicrobiales bacterium]
MAAEPAVDAKPRRLQRFWTFWDARSVWQRRVLAVLAFLVAWPVVGTLVYGVVPPPVSNLMILRLFTGNGIHKDWVSLDEMSPYLPASVISSEDARFCSHYGVDWVEFQQVIGDALDDGEGPSRGASTISMQTAKNLFLWEGRGPLGAVRKVLEMPLALWMDTVWTKRRMIEVYLNIVEWAPGVYGAEAAAQHHFKKPASKLSRREAALLAAVLPNPIKRKAGKPSRGVRFIAGVIERRARGMGPYLTCLDRKKWL